ncbi:MAG: XRE family transcriptional regulator [Candidatus Electrothrix sp. EH2]|nr:XRE family transcriptional regulator [Candidatus Electrothrix sp. EH2]
MSKEQMGLVENFLDLCKELRQNQKLTIEHLADLADVHRTTIGLLERHERSPTLSVAEQISTALGYPLYELIQEASLLDKGSAKKEDLAAFHKARKTSTGAIRNEEYFTELTGLTGKQLLCAIDSCYQVLDTIDEQLLNKNSMPISHLVELANLSSMVGNLLGAGLAECSGGLYERNKPHTYPDLLPIGSGATYLEIKISLETNKPKGHLPKAGTYLTFRYVLGDKLANFQRGKDKRGDTVWIWEVKAGVLEEEDFSCSNTAGDSGKTSVIKTEKHNKMKLIYYVPEFLPYAPRKTGEYPGYN